MASKPASAGILAFDPRELAHKVLLERKLRVAVRDETHALLGVDRGVLGSRQLERRLVPERQDARDVGRAEDG